MSEYPDNLRIAKTLLAMQAALDIADKLAEILPVAVHCATVAGGFLTGAEEEEAEQLLADYRTKRAEVKEVATS